MARSTDANEVSLLMNLHKIEDFGVMCVLLLMAAFGQRRGI